MNYLLLKADGKLYCADIPEQDKNMSTENYLDSKAEAITNALEIVNPEIAMMRGHFVGVDTTTHTTKYTKMVVGELYPWNGGAEVERTYKEQFSFTEKDGYIDRVRLSLPNNNYKECEKPITADRFDPFIPMQKTKKSLEEKLNQIGKIVRENDKRITADRAEKETQEQLWEDAEKIFNQHALHHLAWKSLRRNFTLTRR
jgi:hypothetical protein